MSINSIKHKAMLSAGACLAVVFLALAASGCGGDNQSGSTNSTSSVKTATSTTPATGTNSGMESTVELPASPAPAPAPAPAPSPPPVAPVAPAPLKIVDYAVDPNTVHAGAPLTCMVTVEGTATAVTMGLTGPSGSVSQTVNLIEGTTVGGVTNWTATVAAPAMAGGWRFGATAVATDGTEVIPDAGGLSASLLPFEVIP